MYLNFFFFTKSKLYFLKLSLYHTCLYNKLFLLKKKKKSKMYSQFRGIDDNEFCALLMNVFLYQST